MALDLSGYHLTYDDEFNSFTSSPDGSQGYQTTFYFGGRSLPSNGEQQYYSDSTVGVNPFSLQNGELTITAAPGSNPEGLAYNSGLITTEGSFSQQYGYFEARVEAAQGAGMWNGIWMLPTDKSWPPEIDIMEAFGADNGRGEGGAYQNHVNSITHDYSTGGGGEWLQTPFNIYEGYHTYGVNWQADYTTFYMDGQEVYKVATPSDMHSPMYMLAQLAVGGPWVGDATGETGQIKLDYIRAYSNDASKAAVALDTLSSPDGADTSNMYGAVAANGTPGAGTGGGTNTGGTTDTGTGSNTVTLHVSEDAWNGNAQFTVLVDGKQVGGVQTATASHGAGQWQDITLNGDFSTSGQHTVAVNFVNDAYGGSASADRNLYVQSVTINGETVSGDHALNTASNGNEAADPSAAVMMMDGTATFNATGVSSGTGGGSNGSTTPSGDTLTVHVAEDAYQGDAQFTVLVDGHQVGGTQTATASHAAGQWQDVTLTGDFGTGPHDVAINFINDAWGGSDSTDRNLYVQSVTLNGETVQGTSAINDAANGHVVSDAAAMDINGTALFHTTGTTVTDPGTGDTGSTGGTTTPTDGTLYLRVSEDAWNGDAQFTVSVDGHQVGGTQTATASHAAGQWQDIALTGNFATGPHTVDINFINDAWGGTASADRNLYVQAVGLNGEIVTGDHTALNTADNGGASTDPSAAVMQTNGTSEFHLTGTPTSTPQMPLSTITLHVAEDAWNGDSQFNVLVDGHQVGGTQTATASHAAGQWQDITLTGDFGASGPGHVSVQFLNDAWGGSANADRNLYVQSIDVNGQNFAGNLAANDAANGAAATDPHAAVMQINGTADFDVNHTTVPTATSSSDFWHVA
jgi:beta-glucanase (GH16 family)